MAVEEWEFEVEGVKLGATPPIKLLDFNPGSTTTRSESIDNPTESSRLHSRSLFTPPVWEFQLGIIGPTNVYDSLSTLKGVWLKDRRAGEDIPILYQVGGRERITYGRPSGISEQPRKGIPNRLIDVTAQFSLTHDLSFSTVEQVTNVPMFVAPSGFFTAPFTAPIITTPSRVETTRTVNVGGNAPAPFQVKIFGPITDPYVTGNGWQVDMKTVLTAGQHVVIDTRKSTVIRNDGVSLGGTLNRFSRLSNIRMQQGGDYIVLGGIDPTGSSRAEVIWRDTYSGI